MQQHTRFPRYLFYLLLIISFAVLAFSVNAQEEREELPEIQLELVAEGLSNPVGVDEAPDGSGRLFIIEQTGTIRIVTADGQLLDTPFLDLSDRLVELQEGYDERGLLGLAFHPDYANNGQFYVYYSAPLREEAADDWDHTSHLSRFQVSADNPDAADPASEVILMQVDQPQFNHNAGVIAFGPDGYLYVPLGDGGGRDDEGTGHTPETGNAQDLTNWYGSILRIDVDGGDPYGIPADNPFVAEPTIPDEIWAWGFRNPWGLAFDQGGNNELFVADAGQELWEEVSIVRSGSNYGWNIYEGSHCFDPANPLFSPMSCPATGTDGEPLVLPIIEFSHLIGTVIVGGHVYRGSALPEYDGYYFFAAYSTGHDSSTGEIFVGAPPPPDMGQDVKWAAQQVHISSVGGQPLDHSLGMFVLAFGEDSNGEIYVTTSEQSGPLNTTGKVWRIAPAEEMAAEETPAEEMPEAEMTEEAAAGAQTIQVGLENFAINMPTTISAGPTTFEVTNNSDIEHNFEVEGQGIEQVFDTNLQPGETRTMTIDLPPGTYEVYCPVGNHADMGMRLTLTVTEDGAETPAEGEATPPPPAEATPEAEMTPETTEEVAAQMVPVELASFAINMPVSISAGPTTFEVTNNSDIEHNFEVEGQGIEQVFDTNLQPGETRTMTIDLPPGTYEVYCPVGNHADQGMQLTLTVGE